MDIKKMQGRKTTVIDNCSKTQNRTYLASILLDNLGQFLALQALIDASQDKHYEHRKQNLER